MEQEILDRFESLIETGKSIISVWPRQSDGDVKYWSNDETVADIQSWIQSSANLLSIVVPSGRPMAGNLKLILCDGHYVGGTTVPYHTVQKIQGMLFSACDEVKLGLFKKFEYVVMAETFDDFLDHAIRFHGSNKKIEAAVLSSIVLEDSLKKIAKKNDVEAKGKSLEDLVDSLGEAEIFNKVKVKRIKALNGLRNHALHAEWEEFDIKDVGEHIKGVQSLLEDYL